MEENTLIPRLHLFILILCNLILISLFLIQFFASLWNILVNFSCLTPSSHQAIFNFYLFHHLIICLIRCCITFLSYFAFFFSQECLPIEIYIHFALLISTFDLLLIIIGETAHFWDSSINHRSTLYSKCCLFFGILFNYFVSLLFLSIHITMNGDNPVLVEFCTKVSKQTFFLHNNPEEKSLIPTMITFVLFALIDLLTCSWIYISYRDIKYLKRKSLATVFFHSLVFTKFKRNERLSMVNRSLKRLLVISVFLCSNILATLPLLATKISSIDLNLHQRLVFLYLTVLPWMDWICFLFYDEMRFSGIKIFTKRTVFDDGFYRQQRIGRRLSSYRENPWEIKTITVR